MRRKKKGKKKSKRNRKKLNRVGELVKREKARIYSWAEKDLKNFLLAYAPN